MKVIRYIVIYFIVVGCSLAEEPQRYSMPTEPFVIQDLVSEVLDTHPELLIYQDRVKREKGERMEGGAWSNPNVSVQVGYRELEERERDGLVYGFNFMQPFEFPGKGSLRKAILDQDVYQANLALKQFRLALSGRARQLARRYQLASEKVRAARMVSIRSEGVMRLIKARPQKGARPLIELRILEAGQIRIHEEAKHAEYEYREAQADLNALLGRQPEHPIDLSDTIKAPEIADLSKERVTQLAHRHNLTFQLYEAELEKAKLSTDAAELEAMPDFSFGPFFSREEGAEQEWSAGVRVEMELPLWKRGRGRVVSALASESIARSQMALARIEMDRQIFERLLHYELTEKHYREVNEHMVSRMADAAALADRQYRQGAIDVRLYLESQKAYLETLEIYTETLGALWDVALDIELITGGELIAHSRKESSHGEQSKH
ncbi:MAG: TolC family protein [Verrucomicrobiota bacterium]